jgi:hypothetical protein
MMEKYSKMYIMRCLPKLRSKDGANMSTNGITLQVTKTPGITAADFRAEMAEK